jgi:hypothetical protein
MLNRLEIDVMQANELFEAAQLIVKHKLPAMVVHPDLASEAFIARGRLGGKFKLITPVDWPKGTTFGMNKMRGLSTDALEVDGFEILLTGGMKLIETRNEAKLLTNFVKQHLDEQLEVRFVLGTQLRDEANIKTICEALLDVRMPACVRNSTQLKLQVSKANPDVHNSTMEMIGDKIRVPMKIAGNINSFRTLTSCQGASKFGVSLLQAKIIIKEFQQQPNDELREILSDDADQS